MTDIPFYVLTVLTILCVPGPTNTLLATGAATLGTWRALPLAFAEIAGYCTSIFTIKTLVRQITTDLSVLRVSFRLLVACYLLWLAWRLFRQADVIGNVRNVIKPQRVFLTTLLNPKAAIFALGVIPFQTTGLWVYLTIFVLALLATGIGWIIIGATLGKLASTSGHTRTIPRVGAAIISIFALVLLVTTISQMT